MEEICSLLIAQIWLTDNFKFAFSPSLEASGGGCNLLYLNMYAPCDSEEQERLWVTIAQRVKSFQGSWCVAGDLNCVLRDGKRSGCNVVQQGRENFTAFIDDAGLIDLSLLG
ncbi:hypothetical protein V6N13_088749 [Hibiscus sabdariffa]